MAQAHPRELVRLSAQKELADTYGTRPYLRYRLRKITLHTDTTKEIVETKDGGVACLVGIGGRPLSAAAWGQERSRLFYLRSHPALQVHRRTRENSDALRVKNVLQALPTAFLYKFAGTVSTPYGPAIRMTFVPDPAYHPPSYELRVLRGMEGEIWLDERQLRMVRFDGHTFKDVDLAWGLLGRLDKGGVVQIDQGEVAPPIWSLTHLRLSLTGRTLLVKSLRQSVDETVTGQQRVPGNLTYQQAVDWLLQNNCGLATGAGAHQP